MGNFSSHPFWVGFIDGCTMGPIIRWIGRKCIRMNSHLPMYNREVAHERIVKALLAEADNHPFNSVGHWVSHGVVSHLLQKIKNESKK
jgi:hypothetical protein